MIDLSSVRVVNGRPEVLTLPRKATLHSIGIVPGEMTIRATHQWTPVVINPNDGTQQLATLWMFLRHTDGQWYASGAERLRPNQVNGTKPVAEPRYGGLSTLVGNGWFYNASWSPLFGHNPIAGERVGFMLVAGQSRVNELLANEYERSNVLEVEWPDAAGANPMRILWDEAETLPAPTPAPAPAPAPVPVPAPAPVSVPPTVDLSEVLVVLNRIASAVEAGADAQIKTDARIARLVQMLT